MAAQAQGGPNLTSTTIVQGREFVWDMAFLPDGTMFFTEKCRGLSVRLPSGATNALLGIGGSQGYADTAADLFCDGQAGLSGVAIDPNFAQNRFIYIYSSSRMTAPGSNRVLRLTVNADLTRVAGRTDIVTDIAYKPRASDHPFGDSGAHNGGRLRFGPADGFLYVTTGDTHSGAGPQSPTIIAGKVLRIDRDGRPAAGNNAPAGFDPRVFTYGHRNPQGICFRPSDNRPFTAEHGPWHTDEVTALVPGGNGGWDPQNRPDLKCSDGYCGYSGNPFTMPMTDTQRFPKAMLPAWNNEQRSQGMGPLAFLEGAQWKGWNGKLAVALMRDQRLDIVTLDAQGKAAKVETADLPKLRLRSVVPGPDGALWGSTDDGQILKISPK
jgi:glucose/arabinose dehydrogenase